MPSRRSHTNSHHGCLQCKAKRVKCDQAQPKCSRCDKKNSECTYRHIMTNYNPFQYQQAARAAAAAAAAGEGSSKGGAAGGSGSQAGPSTPALAYTTTTMTQTTPPKAIPGPSAAASASSSKKSTASSSSRSSSAPATPGLTATTAARGPHASSWSGVRKTSFSYHPQRSSRVPSTPAPNAERIMQAIPSQANVTTNPRQQQQQHLPVSPAAAAPPPPPPPPPPMSLPQNIPTGSLTAPSFYPPSSTPTETTIGYTPAAMTILTDPFTLAPVTTAPTPTTLVTTPSPPMLHHTLPLAPFDDNDRFYLDHYRANLTSLGMSPVPESELFAAVNAAILRHLATSTHVQHVIIAYSALHLASTTPNPSPAHAHHLSTALHHKALALERFRPAIQAGITRDNSDALLATASVLVTCGFALPAADPARRTRYNHIDLLAEIFGLVQGTSAILHQQGVHGCQAQDAQAQLAKLNLPSPVGDAPPPWSEGESSLHALQLAIEAIPSVEHTRRALLLHALGKLRRCIEYVGTAQKPTPITCLWLSMIQTDFINLIRQRDQLALVLVSHWAIHHRGNAATTWWSSGWLEAFMMALQQTISPEHKHLIAWCVAYLEQDTIDTGLSSSSSANFVG